MSNLSKFSGLSKNVDVRGQSIKIFPLSVEEMAILDRYDELGKKANNGTLTEAERLETAELGRKLLIAAYKEENLTDEEIRKMDLDIFAELFAILMENVYDLKDGKGLSRIRELKAKVSQEAKS